MSENIKLKKRLRKKFPNAMISSKEIIGHPSIRDDDVGINIRFENDYGASIIRNKYSYGNEDKLLELGVIAYDGPDWELVYNTPVTDDVIGYATFPMVVEELKKIEKFKKGEF